MSMMVKRGMVNPGVLAVVAGAVFTSLAVAQVRVPLKPEPVRPAATPAVKIDRGDEKPQDPQQVVFWLHVLHNNDGESQLINAGSGLEAYGGVARFKTLTENLKAFSATYPADATEKGWVFISSGDNFLAGPEFNASLENGVPFYDSLAMDRLGYSALAIGNHEFDFGPDVLRDFMIGFTGPAPFLSSNLDFTGESGLQALVTSGRIAKSTIVTVGTQQIGIIGATTTDLPFISSPRNVSVSDVLPAVQAEVAALQAQGVNKIIVTSHLQGLSSEFALAPGLSGVDVIIGGGGGELLANPADVLVPGDTPWPTNLGGTGYPRVAVDADGRNVPVVTTRGDYRYVGRLVVGFDAAGNVVAVDTISGPVRVSGIGPDAVTPDPELQALVVDPVAAAVAALGSNVLAISTQPLDGRATSVRAFETNLGNLTADSLLYAASRRAGAFGLPAPDVALQNGGGIRNNNVIPAGNFTELNTFEVLPFANFVSIVSSVPPARFKEILENAVSRVGGSGNGRFAQIAGFSFVWDATGTAQQINAAGQITVPGTRVREAVLNDGRVIVLDGQVAPGAPSVNVATIDFLARGGDQYPFGGQPFGNVGVSYQQALVEYVREFLGGFITTFEYPEGGEGRIIRLN